MSCPEVMYQYYPYIYHQRPPPPHPHAASHPSVAHAANPHTAHHSPARPAPFQPFSTAAPTHQYDRINVNQRSLETTGLELCGTPTATATAATTANAVPPPGVVPQGQASSAGSIGSAPSPASPRPAAPQQQQQQHRPPLTTSAQSSRNLDDDRSTDVGPNTATDDSDDSESRAAHYLHANCVVFTHYRGDAATEVEEHFQRALAQDKPKENTNPMITRNFPASFWKSHHDVYEYTDPWHPHYTHYNPRAVHEYHHHHNMAASYNSLLLNRGLSHHPGSHHPTAMAAAHHSAAASYKDWTSAAAAGAPSQSLVDASSAPPYPHGPYAPLSSDYWT